MSVIPSEARPSSVTWSAIFWLVTVILGLIGSVIIMAGVASAAGVDHGVVIGFAIAAAVIGIIVALVELFFVFKMYRGRNWSRIVLLILAILQIVTNLSQIGSNNLSSWLGLAFVIIASCLMYTPAANRYFHRSKSGLTATSEGYEGI